MGPKAVVNLCGDLGGGYILGGGCRLTLTPARLLRLTGGATRNGQGPPTLDPSVRVQDVSAHVGNTMSIDAGEATFLITDGAKSLAFYVH